MAVLLRSKGSEEKGTFERKDKFYIEGVEFVPPARDAELIMATIKDNCMRIKEHVQKLGRKSNDKTCHGPHS